MSSEVLRDGRGEIARLVYVPAYSVRLLPLDREPAEIQDRVRVSPVSFDNVSTRRRLRRYVQVQGAERVYFKSLRDPRVVSRRTGRVHSDVEALLREDAGDGPASELVHFSIHSPRSPYGCATLTASASESVRSTLRFVFHARSTRKPFEELRMLGSVNAPRARLDLVFHFRDLERLGLVNEASGDALVRPGDRLGAIHDKAGALVQEVRTPPGLYITEARPIGFGLNLARPHRNLLLGTFEDRQLGAGRVA